MSEGLLGKRAERLLQIDQENYLSKGAYQCSVNQYDAVTNPDGCINLGTSENRLVFDLLKDRFNGYNVLWEDYMFTYQNLYGIEEVRQAVAGFLTDQVNAPAPIDPNQILILNGGGICMEALAFAICDPGDGVMVATPYYGGIKNDNALRPETKMIPVHFYSKPEEGQTEPFRITMSKFESVYQEQTKKGERIKALVFMNPNNPLGDVYTKQEILDVIHFCNRHSLHLIMNEVYMKSIFKEGVVHQSVLALRPEEIPDPQRLHFVWAASKDMAMSGMRFGVLHTLNNAVIDCIKSFAYFQSIPVYIQKVMACLFSDTEWLNNVYFPTNQKRLRVAHKVTTDTLDELGVPYLNRESGLFVYADFRKFLPSISRASEMALFYRFIKGGVYIALSQAFYGDELGWFRIIFARPFEEVKLAMSRIAKICKEVLEENKSSRSKTTEEENSTACAKDNSLESLISQLRTNIADSDWLEKNTADRWKAENPELFEEYMTNMK